MMVPSRSISLQRLHRAVGLALAAGLVIAGATTALGTQKPNLAALKAPRIAGVKTKPMSLLAAPGRQPISDAPLGLPARVEDAPNVVHRTEDFPTFAANGSSAGNTKWRIVDGTGNCCENYLSVTPQGMLLDFGGDYITFSVDEGQTWRRVRPADPLPNFGEGTIAVAPNGDIIGVAWNPYYGDRVVPFKYSVEDEGWYYTTTKLHQPFYDRQSVAIIPGPFNWQGQKFPYLTVLRGGWPFKTPTFYSFDGLNYFVPSARMLDVITETIDEPLKIEPDADLDWVQPAEQSGITAFGKGGALDLVGGYELNRNRDVAEFSRLNPKTLRWAKYEFPSGPLPGRGILRVDSKANLHYVYPVSEEPQDGEGGVVTKAFGYMISTDGGRSWSEDKQVLPGAYEVEHLETSVNGAMGVGAVAVQGRDDKGKSNLDWVYKFSTKNGTPKLKRIYQVGDGKGDYGVGVTASGNRFDFATMVIMPDGRLALSYATSKAQRPNLAIQLTK